MVYKGRRQDRDGWMDECFHGDKLRILLMIRHMSYIYCHSRPNSLCDNIGHVPVH